VVVVAAVRARFRVRSASGLSVQRATISSMDVIPLILSDGSLIVAITGLVLTYRRSGQALRESRKAAASALGPLSLSASGTGQTWASPRFQ
jgi:hypothetical protein